MKPRRESGRFLKANAKHSSGSGLGYGGAASLAARRAAVEARHPGVRRCFVDEDGPRRIEIELFFKPCFTRRVHRAATLLGRMRRLFLRVTLRRLKNRQSVPIATATTCPPSFSRSSASVMSDRAATAERINSACALHPMGMAVAAPLACHSE